MVENMINFFKKYKGIIRYLVIGILTTVVNLLVYTILEKYLKVNYNIANILAWFSAVIFAFFTNKIFVFESKSFKGKILKKEFVVFFASRVGTGVLEIASLPLVVNIGIDRIFFKTKGLDGKFLIGTFVVILNYFISKYFVFKKAKDIGKSRK